jgi:hypothetical protein
MSATVFEALRDSYARVSYDFIRNNVNNTGKLYRILKSSHFIVCRPDRNIIQIYLTPYIPRHSGFRLPKNASNPSRKSALS